jgi:hypothetical protein
MAKSIIAQVFEYHSTIANEDGGFHAKVKDKLREGSPPQSGGILTCTCVHVQVSFPEFTLSMSKGSFTRACVTVQAE